MKKKKLGILLHSEHDIYHSKNDEMFYLLEPLLGMLKKDKALEVLVFQLSQQQSTFSFSMPTPIRFFFHRILFRRHPALLDKIKRRCLQWSQFFKEKTLAYKMRCVIKKINRQKISLLFIPNIFRSNISNLKPPLLITTPYPFIFQYPQYYFAEAKALKAAIAQAQHIICYSQRFGPQHIEPLRASQAQMHYIPYGYEDQSALLHKEGLSMRQMALETLKDYQALFPEYLQAFDFDSFQYILCESFGRPHENILSLIKAYSILLRKKFYSFKLILLFPKFERQDITEYLLKEGLYYDVLILENLPKQVIAALYHLALLSVNPVLLQGFFPASFVKSYSVGTPSIMSATSDTLEIIEDSDLRTSMLFEPFDILDITNKIERGLNNRSHLSALQAPIFEKLRARSWQNVAQDYSDCIHEIINKEY